MEFEFNIKIGQSDILNTSVDYWRAAQGTSFTTKWPSNNNIVKSITVGKYFLSIFNLLRKYIFCRHS